MKQLIFKSSILVLTILVPLMSYNFYTDYFGVFHTKLTDRYNEPNMRFIKTRYIVNNPTKYSQFIFGSSRCGKILGNFYDSKVYNMYYSDGLPIEFYEDLKIFIENDVTVQKVYIGLDEFSFKIIPSKHHSQLLRKRFHNDFSNDLASYLQFLIDPPKLKKVPFSIATTFDFENSGNPLHFEVDSLINASPADHINDEKFNKPIFYHGNRADKTIEEIMSLIRLCEKNNIETIFFMNPIFINTYTQYPIKDLHSIKRKISSITNFYDFSGVTSVTTDRMNYYETSHYRYAIGDSIWNIISSPNASTKSTIYNHVSGQNVESLLELEKEMLLILEEDHSEKSEANI